MKKNNKNSKSKKIIKAVSKIKKANLKTKPKAVSKVKGRLKALTSKKEQLGQMQRLLLVIAGILVVFGIFYGIAVLIDNSNKKTEDPAETEIQYDEILVGRLLEQPYSEYYVLVYFENDFNLADYQTQAANYKTKAKALKVYYANLNSAFNKTYIGSKNNTKITKIENFKLSETALIYIKNKKITRVYNGYEKIIEQFETLLK